MPVPFWRPEIGAREQAQIALVPESELLVDGATTARFERTLAERLGVKHAVAITSGTTAIAVALVALGVDKGDEVIVPDLPSTAPANAVRALGAIPVVASLSEETLAVDPRAVDRAITAKTRAVVVVHPAGRAAALDALLALGPPIVEAAGEALGSRAAGRLLGTVGALGCYSFSFNKAITTGQGGMVVTDDDALHARVRELKDERRPVRTGADVQALVGAHWKLTNLQAAVGLAQLERLDARLERMLAVARAYRDGLAGVPGLRLLPFADEERPLWIEALVEDRDAFVAALAARDVACWPFDTATEQGVRLPSGFTLSDEALARVISAVREARGAR